ncbi:putative phage tail protein, partial [Brevibacillus laterosporus]|uniref:putative phage tail protein n=1 Tax=Brevibacillus laterosporus TaxID=1465 RepID=UPI00264DB94F
MGFKEFIFSFFPSGWLNPSADGNKRFFGGIGKSFDYVYELAYQVEQESSVSTAVHTLSDREIEYGLSPEPTLDIASRRSRLLARMQEEDGPVNTEDFEKALGLLSNGIAKVIPNHNDYSVLYHLTVTSSFHLNLILLEEYIRRNKLA